MSDDPTPDSTPDPTPTPDAGTSISEDELKGIVGSVVDEKLAPLMTKLGALDNLPDLAAFKDGLITDIVSRIPAGNSVDESSLVGKIDNVLASRLKNVGSVSGGRKPGAISRWLFGGAS